MNRRRIFRKLVVGYRNQIKKRPEEVARGIFEHKGPVEITGTIKVDEGEEREVDEEKGIELPEFSSLGISRVSKLGIGTSEGEAKDMKIIYPLIPENPSNNEEVMSYVTIEWNEELRSYEYKIFEPKIPLKMKRLIMKIKDLLEERIDIDFRKLKKIEAREYLRKQTFKILDYFGIKLSETDKKIMNYYINRDFLGYGPVEPLMHDPNIEDISCDGTGIPIYIFHRNPTLGSIPTNIKFMEAEELDSYVVRLAQVCGQAVSVIDPLLQGSLPDGSRVQATLSTDIARKGSNFTIRRFTKEPLTPTHLLNYGTIDIKTLALLWLGLDYGSSMLISGGTASGKTTFLNVLSLFIRPGLKIVSIEDTAELKLPHSHWIPHVARISITSESGKGRGEIDLFDLLKESLRQRPDYIIVGEVRGKEAYILFQQMATGHPSLATIHADSLNKLVDRLVTPPISLPGSLIESLDIIVFLSRIRYRDRNVKRLKSVHEISGFDFDKSKVKTKKLFEWEAETDHIKTLNNSITLKRIVEKTGMTEDEVKEELKRRMLILYWFQEKNVLSFEDVSQVIDLYYNYPEKVIDIISGEV